MQRLLQRFYGTAATSQLAKLRRKTGFPIGRCKEALSQHKEDMEAAEKWLYSQAESEGWAKVEKLQGRAAVQGLVGVLVRENVAAMVKVNCETDFVARNEKFQTLVSNVVYSTLEHKTPTLDSSTNSNDTLIDTLTTEDISKISVDASSSNNEENKAQTLADLVAVAVSHLSERVILSGGHTMAASRGLLCGYVYNNVCPADSEVGLGTYGTLLHLLPNSSNKEFENIEAIRVLGKQIGQHIVGLNPEVINLGDEGVEDPSRALVSQRFVLDSEVCVGDLLETNGAHITRFVRYTLAENNTTVVSTIKT